MLSQRFFFNVYKIERRNQAIDLQDLKSSVRHIVSIRIIESKTNQLHAPLTWISMFRSNFFSPFVESSFLNAPKLRVMQKFETEAKHLMKSSISPFRFTSNVYFMYQIYTPYLTTHLPRGDQPNPRKYTNSHPIRFGGC